MTNGPLKQIRIRNYRSLKKLDLEIGKITVIRGNTDAGKSNLFRAVRGAVTNQEGTDFITAGEKKCVVALDDIAWIQSEKDNSYQIGSRKWEKVGRGVPEDVRDALNMGEFEFGTDVKLLLNFSSQFGRKFIVQGNPADNAKVVGSISNIHLIYNALREAEKDTKGIKRKTTTVQEQADQYAGQLDSDEPELERLQKLHDALLKIYQESKEIDDTLTKLIDVKAKAVHLNEEVKAAEIDLMRFEGIDLTAYNEKIAHMEVAIKVADNFFKVTRDISVEKAAQKAIAGISPEEGMQTAEVCEKLLTLKSQASKLTKDIKAAKADLKGKKSEQAKLEKELGKFNACDVCGAAKEHWVGV